MLENKSDKLSIHFKNEGNKCFAKKDYYDALLNWNKALCYAESKENMAMAYANRSLAYFEMKKYELTLKNIQLAIDHHPGDKIQTTLNERKEKCKKLMKAAEEPELNLWNFIKLTYPPNETIPFIVDCLEMRSSLKFGRGIFTKMNLQVGDVIAIERPASLSFLCEEGKYKKCCKCLKGFMLNLIPCTKTSSLMFCSIKCRDQTYKNVENLAWMVSENMQNIHYERILSEVEEAFCGHDKFMKFLKDLGDVKKFNKTVFDYDFVNNQLAKLRTIKSSLSLMPTNTKGVSHEVLEAARKVAKGNSLVENFIKHLATILERNPYLAKYDEEITGDVQAIDVQRFYPFYSLINHSCNANVYTLEAEDALIFYVANPIKANEQLFVNYLGYRSLNSSTNVRQDKLYANFGFICDCILCSNDTSPDEDGSIYEKAMEKAKFSQYVMKKEKDLFNAVRENWRIINFTSLLTAEAHLLFMHSHLMLEQFVILLSEPTHSRINE